MKNENSTLDSNVGQKYLIGKEFCFQLDVVDWRIVWNQSATLACVIFTLSFDNLWIFKGPLETQAMGTNMYVKISENTVLRISLLHRGRMKQLMPPARKKQQFILVSQVESKPINSNKA